MKIAVLSTCVFPMVPPAGASGYGGLEVIAWQSAEGLAARGHDVTLFGAEGSRTDKAKMFATGPAGDWNEHAQFDKSWKELLSCDAIIDETWQKWTLTLKEEGRLKCPVLSVMHAPVDTMYRELPNVEDPCFVCISEDQAAHFRALHSRDVRVARHGVDLDYYKHDGSPRSKRFLFLARFSKIKGASLAIDACRRSEVGLDLVGDTSITNEPDYLEECRSKCDWSSVRTGWLKGRDWHSKVIALQGPASRGECVGWFSQAHALVHANKFFREPFGLAPVEAMACGTPVCCWNNGAMRETISPGETGFLVSSTEDLANAITLLKNMGDHAMAGMRSRCREWVADKFPLSKMVLRYEELIQEALDSGGW